MRIPAVLLLLVVCSSSFAESVVLDSVSYVYDIDVENVFDFAAGANHQCGSNLYRVRSDNAESVKRRFSMVLVAVTADKSLIVNAGPCDGNRRLVGWVRVYK